MKSLFLREVKVKEYNVDSSPVSSGSLENTNNMDPDDLFDDSYYGEPDTVNIISNIDDFRKYNISLDHIVTHKQARTDTEEKRPFIISKSKDKKRTIDERDTIYKSIPKMKVSNKDMQRIGFVRADKRLRKTRLNERRKHKYRGIANDSFLIYKKKPFNCKKIGYLQLRESTQATDLYVEVITNRGYKWSIYFMTFILAIGLFMSQKDMSDWHLNKERFMMSKTEETTEYEEDDLSISFNASPMCKEGKVNINISSEYIENVKYTIELYDENKELLYTSNKINTGDTLEEIELTKIPDIGEHPCKIICNSYKNNRYMGSIESDMILVVQ